jgi:glycosyltransferase involved in cell wall biosynthesis
MKPVDFRIEKHDRYTSFIPPNAQARVLMVPFATSDDLIEHVLKLEENQHHAWGVKEMLAAGVEVAVLKRYSSRLERFGQDWVLPDVRRFDLIYSNHNRLVRTPLTNLILGARTPIVSLVYSGEQLLMPTRHFGIICMTPRAFQRFDGLKNVKVRYAPWGIDPSSALHQPIPGGGTHLVSTGVTGRDFPTLINAMRMSGEKLVLAARGYGLGGTPENVTVVKEFVGPWEIRDLYVGAYAGVVALGRDDRKRSSAGWTNVLEMMAIGLPIIKTRTGALDDIVDLEAIGAGLLVDPESPEQIVSAIRRIKDSPELQVSMGQAGARYVREHLTMAKFAEPILELVFSAIKNREQ